MENILNEAIKGQFVHRLEQLNENSNRQWGVMSVNEMLSHLNDAIRISMGMKSAIDQSNFFTRKIMFPVAVYVMPFWPKGNPTAPEMMATKEGSAPKDFYTELSFLLKMLDVFAEHEPNKFHPHPMFGPLTKTQWADLLTKHIHHHLKQFGV